MNYMAFFELKRKIDSWNLRWYHMAVVVKKGNNRRSTLSNRKALLGGGFYFALTPAINSFIYA